MDTVTIGDVQVSHKVKSNRYEEIENTDQLLQWGYYLIELKTGIDYLVVLKEYLVSKDRFEFDVRYYRKKENELWNKPGILNKTLYIKKEDLDTVKIYDLKKKIVIPSLYELSKEKISPKEMSELREKYVIPGREKYVIPGREKYVIPGGKMKSRKYKYKRRKSISSRKSRSKSLRRSVH